jgi:hypothetical protein
MMACTANRELSLVDLGDEEATELLELAPTVVGPLQGRAGSRSPLASTLDAPTTSAPTSFERKPAISYARIVVRNPSRPSSPELPKSNHGLALSLIAACAVGALAGVALLNLWPMR